MSNPPKNKISDDAVRAVRKFNRFHTRLVGALDERWSRSDYSLPQIRVLYEIAHAPQKTRISARELGAILRLDTGYLSRLVSGLEQEGLIERTPSAENAKRLELALTKKGQDVFDEMVAVSRQEVSNLLEPLSQSEHRQLVGAMTRIQRLLGSENWDRVFILRDPEPGDLGWIVHRQGKLYTEEFGWDWTYEAEVAEIVSRYVKRYDSNRDRCWIAELEGEIVGSVFVECHKPDEPVTGQENDTARLRLLYVDPVARGLGLGRRLVNECIRFARSKGYKNLRLWTTDAQISAHHIYKNAGFKLIDETPQNVFGQDRIGQTWAREL